MASINVMCMNIDSLTLVFPSKAFYLVVRMTPIDQSIYFAEDIALAWKEEGEWSLYDWLQVVICFIPASM